MQKEERLLSIFDFKSERGCEGQSSKIGNIERV